MDHDENMRKIYGEGVTIPSGLLADKALAHSSMWAFLLLMGVLGSTSVYVMNNRKQLILYEAYSKLSIFKKK